MIEILILLLVFALGFKARLQELNYDWLDNLLRAGETHLGRYGWAAVVGVVLVGAACLYVRPDTTCQYLGRHFADLASHPFSPSIGNQIPHRILTPLISYLLGLRGCAVTLTNIMIAAVFIACVYDYFRSVTPRPGDALLAACCITFSLAVLTVIHCGGYCDVLTYLLVFLMWRHRERRMLFYLWFLISLFNRESVVFLLPWFAFISLHEEPHKLKRTLELITGFSIPLIIYGWFYYNLSSHQDFEYSVGYYIKPLINDVLGRFMWTLPHHGLGLFSVYQILWIIPGIAVAHAYRARRYLVIFGLALPVLCAWMQMFVANDTSRMFTLGFIVMIPALENVLTENSLQFRRWAYGLLLFHLIVPQLYTAGPTIEIWKSLALHLALS